MVDGGGEVMANVAFHDEMLTAHEDLLAPDVIEDPYAYFGRLREEDPVHWNPLYDTWVITRYDDVVWSLRHPECFSSEVFLRDPRPPYPPILDADEGLYDFNKRYLSHWFIRRDPPDHTRLRRRLRKILWEQWRKPKTRYRKLVALGVDAERARKATATGRGAWWNAGASHMHAAVTNRLLAEWGC